MYPEIGKKAQYTRQKRNGDNVEIVEGIGTILAICLDPGKRLMAHMRDGADVFNVDLNCLNADEDFKAKFRAVTAEVEALRVEGNAAAQAVIDDYNARVEKAYDAILGVPLALEEAGE